MKTISPFGLFCQTIIAVILFSHLGLLAFGFACFNAGDQTALRHIAICASSFLVIGIPWWLRFCRPVLKAKEEDDRRIKEVLRRVKDPCQTD